MPIFQYLQSFGDVELAAAVLFLYASVDPCSSSGSASDPEFRCVLHGCVWGSPSLTFTLRISSGFVNVAQGGTRFALQSPHMSRHTAACSGHAGTASCSFSSDRGTFTALADGSTTVMDAVTTGQMVHHTTPASRLIFIFRMNESVILSFCVQVCDHVAVAVDFGMRLRGKKGGGGLQALCEEVAD